MSGLRRSVEEYLALRRSFGYSLERPARLLEDFVEHLEARGDDHVRVDVALAWATAPGDSSPGRWADRLSAVRGFARYQSAFDDRNEVPPRNLLAANRQRKTPYVYSGTEIAALMSAARRLAPPSLAAAFETLIGLMTATGLRPGETYNLHRDDVDLAGHLLIVRDSKAGSSRLVPLHPTTVAALARYQCLRDELLPSPTTQHFFLSQNGRRLGTAAACATFRRLLQEAQITAPPGRRSPRLYDLRHRFAVATLVAWYGEDANVQQRLPVLSTYMGHLKPKDTYWYLEAVPELMALAAHRLESFLGDRP